MALTLPVFGTEPVLPRRLAAIAFADIVGFSILAAADEARIASRWVGLFREVVAPAAEAQGGRIVDMQGDGTLAEFPDVAAALAWAKRLHAAAETAGDVHEAPITFRIAIHAGSVIAAGEQILGDAVNTAARLQEYATPGGTLLSAEAAALLDEAERAGARDMGELPLRNLSRAVRAISLDPPRPVPVPLPPPPGLLPSVVVLPLENLGGDAADGYLAAGVVEDVATSLAGLHEVFVVAPETARAFAGQSPTPQRVGRALGVRFVVTGGLRRAGGGLFAQIRLSDAQTGEQIWGERIEAAEREVFDIQEHIVGRIVAGVAPNIRAVTLREAMRKRPESLTAYDHMLRGLHAMSATHGAGFLVARDHLMAAVAVDPHFSQALAWLGQWHSMLLGHGWSQAPLRDIEAAMQFAEAATQKDPNNALGLAVFGHLNAYHRRDPFTAQDCFERALRASPGSAIAWTLSSGVLSYTGKGARAVEHATRGLRLSPYDPLRFSQRHFLAIARYASDDLEAAEREQRVSLGANPHHAASWRMLSACLAAQGRLEEAGQAFRRMGELEPGFDLTRYAEQRSPFLDDALRDQFSRDLTRAAQQI
jgi:adenylate cyclase